MPCVALVVYCLQTTIVVVYCVSLLVFILVLAPGFIHIVTDLCYVVTPDDSTDFNDDFNDNYKDNFAKNSVDKHNKINIILTTILVIFVLIFGFLWALNDDLRGVIIDYVWVHTSNALSSFTSSSSSSSSSSL